MLVLAALEYLEVVADTLLLLQVQEVQVVLLVAVVDVVEQHQALAVQVILVPEELHQVQRVVEELDF
jgi:hypothetical protein